MLPRLLAAALLCGAAAATESWVVHVYDWSCDSYDVTQDGVTLDVCTSLCAGFAYMAHWWGGEEEGRCGCAANCDAGAATDLATGNGAYNIVFRSAAARGTYLDTWGIFRKDWDCHGDELETEATGLDLQECLDFCGGAGYSHTQHWWGGTDHGKCGCAFDCDEQTDTSVGSVEHVTVYREASEIQETWAFIRKRWRCDTSDSSQDVMGLESCIGQCSSYDGMYHYENSNYYCRCANDCSTNSKKVTGVTNKVYRAIPLQSTWVEWKENYGCKQFYDMRAYAHREDLDSCMEFCSGYTFLIHRSYGSAHRCQCLLSCESPTAVSGQSAETVKIYKAVPIQMLYDSTS